MATALRMWTSRRGEEVGVTVTGQAVEFWRMEPGNIHYRVFLTEFVYEQIGVDQTEFMLGEEKTVEVYEYVAALLEAGAATPEGEIGVLKPSLQAAEEAGPGHVREEGTSRWLRHPL